MVIFLIEGNNRARIFTKCEEDITRIITHIPDDICITTEEVANLVTSYSLYAHTMEENKYLGKANTLMYRIYHTTDRIRECVLFYIRNGYDIKSVSEVMYIKPRSVERYLQRFKKGEDNGD